MPRKISEVQHGQEVTQRVFGKILGAFARAKPVRALRAIGTNTSLSSIGCKKTDIHKNRIH